MFVRIAQIFTIITLYVELVKGDCTACLPPTQVCDPSAESNGGANGLFFFTSTSDENGCTVITVYCADGNNDTAGNWMIGAQGVSSSNIS